MPIDFERQKFFWSRVEKDGDHLIWTGASRTRGYGIMEIDGKKEYVHRIAWCIANNLNLSDIETLIILRTCDRNDCVEPEHLTSKAKKTGQAKPGRKPKAKRK